MSRLADALMQGQAFSRGRAVPMLDLQQGGQHGWAPNLAEWASTTHYVRKNINCVLVEAPGFFQYMPEPEYMVSALKSMVEVHALQIDGLKSTLTVEWAETAVGGANEMFQDLVDVKRERSVPSFLWKDMYGRPIQNFLSDWIYYGLMDPETKAPMYTTIAGVKPSDQLNDMMSATMLFWEPDPTFTKIQKAWLTTNMMPKTSGEIIGKRDLTAAGEVPDLQVEFSGLTQTGFGVVALAQQVMDRISLANANPYLRTAFMKDITADVLSNMSGGYKRDVEIKGAEAVQPS